MVDGSWMDYREHNDDTTVHFEVIMSEENLIMAKQEGLLKKFKLTTTISTSNMHLFDLKGVIKKYETPEQILEEFFHVRLEFYEKRKHFTALIICHKEVIRWMTLWNAFKDEFENEKNMLGGSLGRSSTRLMLGEKNDQAQG
ncbi:DNA topoisomerase 2-like isoform X2 [Camellia sinensis]|uniref:DNA topoisomerase 2-like isoform X2 n=1 Tax=Camellia sinensis TaxID=4442 RepID=UPI001036EC89|nr:DNA topoisomerase 2-like isoform X2 [Camellia sinensis]